MISSFNVFLYLLWKTRGTAQCPNSALPLEVQEYQRESRQDEVREAHAFLFWYQLRMRHQIEVNQRSVPL